MNGGIFLDETTVINVKIKTAQRIKTSSVAEFGDSYDSIINKLLDKIEKKNKRREKNMKI